MGRAFGLLLVAVVTGLLVYRLAGPLFAPSPPTVTAEVKVGGSPEDGAAEAVTERAAAPAADASATPSNSGADLVAPVSASEQAHIDLESKRAPYYDWIRKQAGGDIADVAAAEDDGASLVLYLARDDGSTVPDLVQQVVAPYARHYGFLHARLFLPNAPGNVEQYRLYAEADMKSGNQWITFLK